MSRLNITILRLYGRGSGALRLIAVPILVLTLAVIALNIALPGEGVFWFGAWCVAVIVQVIGVFWARQIRLKNPNLN